MRIRPDHAEAYNNLGNALRELGQFEEAEACLRQALRLKPDYAEAAYNLGVALWSKGDWRRPRPCYRQAIRLKPDYAEAHLNLGNCLKDQGQIDEAIAAYRTALELKPAAADFHSNLILTLHYHPGYDQRAIGEECRALEPTARRTAQGDIQPHANLPDPERRLRVGYLSPEFRDHADAFFTVPLLVEP